jgi:oxygen-independent coproporphyrinogen-3 oxidase
MPPRRRSNAALTDRYIELLRDRTLPIDFEETVDAKALAREMIFLGLRTAEGVNEADFKSNAGLEFASLARMPLLEKFVQNGMIEHTAPFWRLTERGMLFADGIASELF